MKSSEILLLGGAGLLVWYFGFGPGKHTAVLAPSSTPASGNNPLPLLSQGQMNPVSIPVDGVNQRTQTGQNPNATLAQQQTIFEWANTMSAADQAQFYAKWGQMTASDVSGLMDLIVNEWQGGQPVTPARTKFWDTWRVTYGIDI